MNPLLKRSLNYYYYCIHNGWNTLFGLGSMTLALLCAAPESCQATEWYVSPNASSGGTGATSNPWQLAVALNHPAAVKPGDTIWLRGGTYRGAFSSHLQGSPGNWITVRQYPGERA